MLQRSIVLGMSRVAFHPTAIPAVLGKCPFPTNLQLPPRPPRAAVGWGTQQEVHVGVSSGVIPAFPLCLC